MNLINLLLSVLNHGGEKEKEPWEKDNSWLIRTSILPEFRVTQVFYKSMYTDENLNSGISDVSFVVTKV